MGYIFAMLAIGQTVWDAIKRATLWAIDSLADTDPGYYGLAGEWITERPDATDAQQSYSDANAVAQATGSEYERWIAASDATVESDLASMHPVTWYEYTQYGMGPFIPRSKWEGTK